MQINKPKLHKILLTDFFSFTLLLLKIILPIIFLLRSSFSEMWIEVLTIPLVLIFILICRIVYIYNIFKNGIEVEGIIRSISFYKDRGKIHYAYAYNNMDYKRGNAVMKNKVTKSFEWKL